MSLAPPKSTATILSALVAVLVVAAAVFYLSGGYRDWRDDRALDSACSGALPGDEVREVLGGGHPEVSEDGTVTASTGLLTHCAVHGTERTGISLEAREGPEYPGLMTALKYHHSNYAQQMAVPLGAGWHGVLVHDNGPLSAVVELACTDADHRGHGVLALIRTDGRDEAVERSARRRAAFGRLATAFATKVAEQHGCAAEPGDEIDSVPASPRTAPRSLAKGSGTCEALPAVVRRGSGLALDQVWQAPADGSAPLEDCYLLGGGKQRYQLTAFYGGLAGNGHAAAGDVSRAVTAKASCPDGSPDAFYALTRFEQSDDDSRPHGEKVSAVERSALRTFAERSAERHGCSAVSLHER